MKRIGIIGVLLLSVCLALVRELKHSHHFSAIVAAITPVDPEAGYTAACNSVISEIEATGGHLDGTVFVLAAISDESIPLFNKRLSEVCRPSVSIMSAAAAKTYGWTKPSLFGAVPLQPFRFHQWLAEHPQGQYVSMKTGTPVLLPTPDVSDAQNLLAAEDHLAQLKHGKVASKNEFKELFSTREGDVKKQATIEFKQDEAQAVELALLTKARDAGMPIEDRNLTAWARNSVQQFEHALKEATKPEPDSTAIFAKRQWVTTRHRCDAMSCLGYSAPCS